MIKRIQPKKLTDICMEWDGVCDNRQNAIDNGQDISLISVTTPCILRNMPDRPLKNILDAGCGTGYTTSLIAQKISGYGVCWGIDISKKSISIAKNNYHSDNIRFLKTSIEEFCPDILFDLCISSMALTSDPNWGKTLKKIYELLASGGELFVMITHPCFWPKYWGYQDETWFDYDKEIFIEHDFSISLVKSMGKTTYIHRPLSCYIDELIKIGFSIEKIEEPYPVGSFPNGYNYQYPRFLFIKCRK